MSMHLELIEQSLVDNAKLHLSGTSPVYANSRSNSRIDIYSIVYSYFLNAHLLKLQIKCCITLTDIQKGQLSSQDGTCDEGNLDETRMMPLFQHPVL
jgi:hypothetical protein